MNVYYIDVWTDPAVRAPDASLRYSYNDRDAILHALPADDTGCLDSFGRPLQLEGELPHRDQLSQAHPGSSGTCPRQTLMSTAS